MTAEKNVLNTSGYKFIALDNLENLRDTLKAKALEYKLKGTILLSEEGINAFMAGSADNLNAFRNWMVEFEPRFSDMPWKDSWSVEPPFNRTLVKIKKEIISMDHPMICQDGGRAKAVTPKELKEWLDKGEEVVLMDTRNDYELKLGTFEKALDLNLDHFREFPERIKEYLDQYKNKRIVTFCTGGIRCEKAVLYMNQIGFEDVYQLDGGILKYFEECQGDHYQGDCFVFDKRVAVNPNLDQSHYVMCFACQAPLTPEDQNSPLYIYEEQCPYCVHGKKKATTQHSNQLSN